jgi:hypothetical protein
VGIASLALFLALASSSGCALVVPQPPIARDAPELEPEPAALLAGAGRAVFGPDGKLVPIAGFGPSPALTRDVLVESDGTRHDLFARAVSISSPAGLDGRVDRLILVSLESLVVPRSLRARALLALERRGRVEPRVLERSEIVVAATHTHFGMGGYWPNGVAEWASIGPYDDDVVARTADAIAAAIESAIASERPARLASVRATVPDLVGCRAHPATDVDDDLVVVGLDDERGAPIARIVVLGSHPTELYGIEKLSGAWPGACMRALEKKGGTALVFQGALGDQSASFPPTLWTGLPPAPPEGPKDPGRVLKSRRYGEEVAARAQAAIANAPRSDAVATRVVSVALALPPPTYGLVPIPILDRLAAWAIAGSDWPDRTRIVEARLGTLLLAFAPFELIGPTTRSAKHDLRKAGFRDVAIVSLANDWLGYAPDLIPWPWNTSGSASFGGVGMGHAIGDRIVEAGKRIAPPRR